MLPQKGIIHALTLWLPLSLRRPSAQRRAFVLFKALMQKRLRPLFADSCAGLRPHMQRIAEILQARCTVPYDCCLTCCLRPI